HPEASVAEPFAGGEPLGWNGLGTLRANRGDDQLRDEDGDDAVTERKQRSSRSEMETGRKTYAPTHKRDKRRSTRPLDVVSPSPHGECGADPRQPSRDSAPAGVQCEAKGGTLPDPSVGPLRSPRALLGSGCGVPKGDLTMTNQKDFKRLVRARMKKTGES